MATLCSDRNRYPFNLYVQGEHNSSDEYRNPPQIASQSTKRLRRGQSLHSHKRILASLEAGGNATASFRRQTTQDQTVATQQGGRHGHRRDALTGLRPAWLNGSV
jgi:hypothetical protein